MSRSPEGAENELEFSPDAVSILVDNHRQLLDFLERRVGDRALAEDILQDAFARGLDKLEGLRSPASVMAWFYRSLRNAVVDHHRRRGAAERKLAAFGAELERANEPGAELGGAICRCVSELAGTLKPEYADALQSVEVEGMPVKDYAARAGITASNAGVRVFRAREALRTRVARACGSCAEHGCLDCSCGSAAGR